MLTVDRGSSGREQCPTHLPQLFTTRISKSFRIHRYTHWSVSIKFEVARVGPTCILQMDEPGKQDPVLVQCNISELLVWKVFYTEPCSPEAPFLDVTVPPRKEKWSLQRSVPKVQVTEIMEQPCPCLRSGPCFR